MNIKDKALIINFRLRAQDQSRAHPMGYMIKIF
jgi:hypothetical protein